jgi:hypothetical protein
MAANKISGADAGGPRRLPILVPRAARAAHFRRWAQGLDLPAGSGPLRVEITTILDMCSQEDTVPR